MIRSCNLTARYIRRDRSPLTGSVEDESTTDKMQHFYQGLVISMFGGMSAAIVTLLMGYPQLASIVLTPTGAIATGLSAGWIDDYRRRQD